MRKSFCISFYDECTHLFHMLYVLKVHMNRSLKSDHMARSMEFFINIWPWSCQAFFVHCSQHNHLMMIKNTTKQLFKVAVSVSLLRPTENYFDEVWCRVIERHEDITTQFLSMSMCCCWQDLLGSPGLPIIIVWWPTSIRALDSNMFVRSANLKDLHAKIQICMSVHSSMTHAHTDMTERQTDTQFQNHYIICLRGV